MGHWGPLEWVRCSSKIRRIIAIFSHIQLHDAEPNRKVYFAWKVSPNYMGGTSPGRKGSGASKAERGHAGADKTWTQVAFGACLPRF